MTTAVGTIVLPVPMQRSRSEVLRGELTHAFSRIPRSTLDGWAKDSARLLGRVSVRRVKNLIGLVGSLAKGTAREVAGATAAFQRGDLDRHASGRAKAAGQSMKAAKAKSVEVYQSFRARMDADPKETATEVIIGSLSFLATSGGLDGDGGAPDLDLVAGIDAHRSVLTHSVISGAVIETLLESTAMLVDHLYQYLPPSHDPIWDEIQKRKNQVFSTTARGASLGIAYHLGVDAVVQPAAYHDLPVPAPIEVHQTIMGANAVAEGLDARNKGAEYAEAPATPMRAARVAKRVPAKRLPDAAALDRLRERHRTLQGKPATDLEAVVSRLPTADIAILRNRGAWLEAMAKGTLELFTEDQRHFLKVHHGKAKAISPTELAWSRYLNARAAAGLGAL